MSPIVHLTTIVIVIYLYPPASEGVQCYFCIHGEKGSGLSAEKSRAVEKMGLGNVTRLGWEIPTDPPCKSGKPNMTIPCEFGCAQFKLGDKTGTLYLKGCSNGQGFGCGTAMYNGTRAEWCFCSTDLCNNSYTLTYEGILVALSLVIFLSIRQSLS